MHKPIPSSPVLFDARLWSNQTRDDPPPATATEPVATEPTALEPTPTEPTPTEPATPLSDPPRTPSPPATPLSRRSVSFHEVSPFITVDPSAPVFDAFHGHGSAISPASTASPLPHSPAASPSTAPHNAFAEPEAQTGSAQVFDAFSWSAAITPHDYATAPQPYTPGHPANVAHREAMEREAYEGADPDIVEGDAGPSRRGSSSSRRRGSTESVAASSSAGAGTSVAHARAVTHSVKPKSHARKMSAGHILRPRNAFIIFRSTMIKDGAITENMEKDHGNISTICGMLWRKLPAGEKLKYQRMADLEKEQHRIANPGYKYAPKSRKEPPARRRQKKDQDVVAQRCALAASLLADGRRGSEMARQLEHFDKEVAVQIKREKEEAVRLGIRPDPYAYAHSAKKLKKLERERKERERALAAQAGAMNLREGVLEMHARADAEVAEKRARAVPPPTSGPFSRTPRNAYASPTPVAPAPVAAESAPSWTNPWASSSGPENANMGRRPSSCPPPAAGAIALPALPSVPAAYNEYVSPTAPHASHMMNELAPPNHHVPAAAPLHHPQPQNGLVLPRRRSSSVPPPSLYAAPFGSANPSANGWDAGRRSSVVFSMELERRPSQVQWNDDMGMGDARRPSIAWNRRPSGMMWGQERRMSAQAGEGWYGGMNTNTNAVDHIETEPQINFGNYSFQTVTNGSSVPASAYTAPANSTASVDPTAPAVPDQSYQFPPPSDVEMYHDMNPSPFGTILAQGWQPEPQSALSPVYSAHSHAPHTPEGDFQHPRAMPPNPAFHQYGAWAGAPHTPIMASSPHTAAPGEDDGDMFQPFGEEVAFPELNQEGAGVGRVGVKYNGGVEDDLTAYSQGADGLGIGVAWGV
ncbi:hypothetical protein FRC06_000505 [Ceratobasidium sp. 370]|nr:hypothetical protein FRC06_000505 [Ceratobasidium sp. 370]